MKFISVYSTLSFSYCPSHPKHPEEKKEKTKKTVYVWLSDQWSWQKMLTWVDMSWQKIKRHSGENVGEGSEGPWIQWTTFNLFLFSLLGLIVATSLFSRFLKFRQIIVSHLLCVDIHGPLFLCVLWSLPYTVHGMVSYIIVGLVSIDQSQSPTWF